MTDSVDHGGDDVERPRLTPLVSQEAEWEAVMTRCGALLPPFAEVRLNVNAKGVADALGLRNADALRKLLVARRLPPFRMLRDWCYVVQLADRFADKRSIASWAMRRGEYPTVYYRFVRAVTGQPWRVVLARGPAWAKGSALHVWSPYLIEEAM